MLTSLQAALITSAAIFILSLFTSWKLRKVRLSAGECAPEDSNTEDSNNNNATCSLLKAN